MKKEMDCFYAAKILSNAVFSFLMHLPSIKEHSPLLCQKEKGSIPSLGLMPKELQLHNSTSSCTYLFTFLLAQREDKKSLKELYM